MIIIKLMGGLGNQMQQYALYRKFITLGADARLDTTWYESTDGQGGTPRGFELSHFKNADYISASKAEIADMTGKDDPVHRLIRKAFPGTSRCFRESSMYHPGIFDKKDAYLEGYWSAEKYYADILDDLRGKFSFDDTEPEMGAGTRDMAKTIGESGYSCSVHIRRGDYLDPENAAVFGGISTEEYYASAFEHIKSIHPDAVFFIFSDDVSYVRERYGDDPSCISVDVNRGAESFFDIYLMSLCNAHICANSSFSFWGARLDRKPDPVCIRPTVHVNTQVYDERLMKDLWKGWTFIDPSGILR